MADVVIKKSSIHGKGVFAARDFKKGETVIDWKTCSTQLTKQEVEILPRAQKRYVSRLGQRKYVLFRSPGKFVNHSCNPNTRAIRGRDVARRDIKAGEEITADYIAEEVPILKMECNCSSKLCKKTIIYDKE